jgi:hypothetical protein
MDDLIRELEEAFTRANTLAERLQGYIAAGRGIPHRLIEASAKADEELLQKLLDLQLARRPAGWCPTRESGC